MYILMHVLHKETILGKISGVIAYTLSPRSMVADLALTAINVKYKIDNRRFLKKLGKDMKKDIDDFQEIYDKFGGNDELKKMIDDMKVYFEKWQKENKIKIK